MKRDDEKMPRILPADQKPNDDCLCNGHCLTDCRNCEHTHEDICDCRCHQGYQTKDENENLNRHALWIGGGRDRVREKLKALKYGGGAPRFVAVGHAVMLGQDCVTVAKSGTYARRIANALNQYEPGQKGY